MKTSAAMDPNAAFPDATLRPRDPELSAVLGAAFAPVSQLLTRLPVQHPGAAATWTFSPRVGWYQVQMRRKRRLLYLVPKRGDFRLSVIVGDRALKRLRSGPFKSRVARRLKHARRYPEGTLFEFDRASCDVDLLLALIDAKLTPTP